MFKGEFSRPATPRKTSASGMLYAAEVHRSCALHVSITGNRLHELPYL